MTLNGTLKTRKGISVLQLEHTCGSIRDVPLSVAVQLAMYYGGEG